MRVQQFEIDITGKRYERGDALLTFYFLKSEGIIPRSATFYGRYFAIKKDRKEEGDDPEYRLVPELPEAREGDHRTTFLVIKVYDESFQDVPKNATDFIPVKLSQFPPVGKD